MLHSRWGRLTGLIVLIALVVLLWRAWHDPLDESAGNSSAPSVGQLTLDAGGPH